MPQVSLRNPPFNCRLASLCSCLQTSVDQGGHQPPQPHPPPPHPPPQPPPSTPLFGSSGLGTPAAFAKSKSARKNSPVPLSATSSPAVAGSNEARVGASGTP